MPAALSLPCSAAPMLLQQCRASPMNVATRGLTDLAARHGDPSFCVASMLHQATPGAVMPGCEAA